MVLSSSYGSVGKPLQITQVKVLRWVEFSKTSGGLQPWTVAISSTDPLDFEDSNLVENYGAARACEMPLS